MSSAELVTRLGTIMESRHFADEIFAYTVRVESGTAIDGAQLARILKKLTELEVEEGGPYALSIGGELDIGMNLAVARFLAGHDVRLPKLEAYLDSTFTEDAYSNVFGEDRMRELVAWRAAVQGATGFRLLAAEDPDEERIFSAIRLAAKERFASLSPYLSERAEAVMERTIRGNPDNQMSLMALYVRQALGEKGHVFTDRHVAELGLANVFFWTAFIIYDDFWDVDEAADPKLLPVANIFARHYSDFFSRLLPQDSGFRDFFHEVMDKLDGANEWETSVCRTQVKDRVFTIPSKLPEYGDFGIKFYPAAGQILGPVSMLVALGYPIGSREVTNFVDYFRHYLVAMQLNDDMHDWKEDLGRGHISTAVSVLLEKWLAKYPDRREIRIDADMPELEQLFWFESLQPLCDAALKRVALSERALSAVPVFAEPAPLTRFISRNKRIVDEALSEYQRSRDFLRVFA